MSDAAPPGATWQEHEVPGQEDDGAMEVAETTYHQIELLQDHGISAVGPPSLPARCALVRPPDYAPRLAQAGRRVLGEDPCRATVTLVLPPLSLCRP